MSKDIGTRVCVVYNREKLGASQWPVEGEIDYGTLRTIKLFKGWGQFLGFGMGRSSSQMVKSDGIRHWAVVRVTFLMHMQGSDPGAAASCETGACAHWASSSKEVFWLHRSGEDTTRWGRWHIWHVIGAPQMSAPIFREERHDTTQDCGSLRFRWNLESVCA